jgi:hypothetical protein
MIITTAIKRLFAPSLRETVDERLASIVSNELDRVLPNIVEKILMEKFEAHPTKQLSAVGFTWALVLYFEKSWPDMGRSYSIACAHDCLEGMGGPSDYDWSASAAKELVAYYVAEHGEVS